VLSTARRFQAEQEGLVSAQRSLWSSLLHIVGAAENVVTIARVRRKLARGRLGDLELVTHRGYGTTRCLRLQARVVESRGVTPGTVTDPWWRNVEAAYRRFVSLAIPGAMVRATIDGQTVQARTDIEGYAQIELENRRPDVHGWRQVDLELASLPLPGGQQECHATAAVLVPDPRAGFGVISDIDDTVLHTGLTERAGMLRTTLLLNATTRLPYAGVAAFYRALHEGEGAVARPIFYVSGSPWNLYDVIESFFAIQGIPPGPLFLKDWGIDEHKFIKEDTKRYKLERIGMLLETYPTLDFVLIGDSGQEDPEIYAEVVRHWPQRIRAVYIRDVNVNVTRDHAVQELLRTLADHDVPAALSESTLAAANDAALRGLIAARRLDELRQASERDAPA
jgi:phosphatidate phosphatase APP1